jgi:Bcr/CflA subfamily drug resistance transporter
MKQNSSQPMLNLPVWLISLFLGFPQISETIFTPSLPDISASLHVENHQVSMLLSIYFAGFSLGVFLWGVLSDRIGRRAAMLAGLFIYICGSLGCCISGGLIALLLSRFVQALGASAGSVVTQTMIRDVYVGSKRSEVFGVVGAALAFSPAIGPVLGGFIDQYFSWKANFFFLFVMGLILFWVGTKYLVETRLTNSIPSSSSQIFVVGKKIFTDLRVIRFAVLIAAYNGIIFSYYGEAPFTVVEILHYTPSQYGFLGLVVSSVFFAAAKTSNLLLRRYDSHDVIVLGSFCSHAGAMLFLGLAYLGLIDASHGFLAVVALMAPVSVIFFGIGMMLPNCLSIALSEYQHVLGTAASWFGLMYYVLIAFFTEMIGFLHDGTVFPMPIYFFVLTGLMVVLTYHRYASHWYNAVYRTWKIDKY